MNAYTYLFTFLLLLMYSSFTYFHGVSSKGQNTLKFLTINISVNILKSTYPTAFDGNNPNTNSKYTKLGIYSPGPLWTVRDFEQGFLTFFNLMRNRHFGYVLISLFDDESSHGKQRFSM